MAAEDARACRIVSFGEAMLRFAPRGSSWDSKGAPSALTDCMRSVAGDEMNVCVALARLGREAHFVTVLPEGVLADVVRGTAVDAGVLMDHVVTDQLGDAELGTFYVVPEEGRVHYQRRHSSFARQEFGQFNWQDVLGCSGPAPAAEGLPRAWLHITGITPMLGSGCAANWVAHVEAAKAAGIPVSMDLNFRPQLGSFGMLWELTRKVLSHVDLLILSMHSAKILADHLGLQGLRCPSTSGHETRAGVVAAPGTWDTEAVTELLLALHKDLAGPALACCMKERDGAGVQRRWSVMVDGIGVVSTEKLPTRHKPVDETGGGSAWAAGVIDYFSQQPVPTRSDGVVSFGGAQQPREAPLRRGDILAALSQETLGDHCTATRVELEAVESASSGQVAEVGGEAASAAHMSADVAASRVAAALHRIKSAKVIAILRAKHEQRAVERAMELADVGYRAVEVTADSVGFQEGTLLPAVVAAVGDRCLVGIGTVTTPEQLALAAKGGAHFVLSPVRPTVGFGSEGFVRACHRLGMLAMPAAFTPQEIYECVENQGAHTVKIFPSQLWSPSALKDLRRIGDFGKYLLCPSGGIDCNSAAAWLEAGATAVGMGSCLVGKDVATAPTDEEGLAAAEANWHDKAKPDALRLAKELGLHDEA